MYLLIIYYIFEYPLTGIIATSIMIIVIGCRLRVMRNRYRKGSKQSYAHDADFLINGMYL